MNQTQTQTQTDRSANRRRTPRATPRRTDRRARRGATPTDEADAPLVPDVGVPDDADTGTYRPNPFEQALMEGAE